MISVVRQLAGSAFEELLHRLGESPRPSIPSGCAGWGENHAAYRRYVYSEVRVEKVLAPAIPPATSRACASTHVVAWSPARAAASIAERGGVSTPRESGSDPSGPPIRARIGHPANCRKAEFKLSDALAGHGTRSLTSRTLVDGNSLQRGARPPVQGFLSLGPRAPVRFAHRPLLQSPFGGYFCASAPGLDRGQLPG